MKQLSFDQGILDMDLHAALARRTRKATIQPVSASMSALRWRTSPTERAGGNTTRNGPA